VEAGIDNVPIDLHPNLVRKTLEDDKFAGCKKTEISFFLKRKFIRSFRCHLVDM
jgi:hypothetical protein